MGMLHNYIKMLHNSQLPKNFKCEMVTIYNVVT
jgi:hypothetical protein